MDTFCRYFFMIIEYNDIYAHTNVTRRIGMKECNNEEKRKKKINEVLYFSNMKSLFFHGFFSKIASCTKIF